MIKYLNLKLDMCCIFFFLFLGDTLNIAACRFPVLFLLYVRTVLRYQIYTWFEDYGEYKMYMMNCLNMTQSFSVRHMQDLD